MAMVKKGTSTNKTIKGLIVISDAFKKVDITGDNVLDMLQAVDFIHYFERIRELAGHSRQSIVLYTNYFYSIPGLEGISDCKTFAEVVDYKMPSLKENEAESAGSDTPGKAKNDGIIPFRRAI